MVEASYLATSIVGGFVIGFIYSIVALGITIIYGILHIPDFSHGNRYMLGAYAGFATAMAVANGFSYFSAILAAILASALIALASYRLVYKKLHDAPHITSFIAAIGLLLLLEGVALAIFGPRYQSLNTPFDYVVNVGGLRINFHRIVVLIASVLAIAALFIFLKKTVTGVALEATAQSPIGARLVGIKTEKMTMLAFILAGALAGYSAALIAPITYVYPTMGAELNLKAFVICVVGGLGNIPGAIVGGLLLGLIEALFGSFVAIKWKGLVAFAILVAILCLKPEGLFGKRVRRA
ncbi:MAG: branched-chain amino acid ABC transporter permease [Archaeoglobaceae archaeon]